MTTIVGIISFCVIVFLIIILSFPFAVFFDKRKKRLLEYSHIEGIKVMIIRECDLDIVFDSIRKLSNNGFVAIACFIEKYLRNVCCNQYCEYLEYMLKEEIVRRFRLDNYS